MNNLRSLILGIFLIGWFGLAGIVNMPVRADWNAENMMPVDQVKSGMTGYGKTVFRGTEVETFPVRVEGVLQDVLPGQDLILISSDHPILNKAKIISGMSGSPIYLEGKLIGALGYSWPFQREPIAGVTPIRSMLEGQRLPDSAEQMAGLKPITTPVVASGLTGRAESAFKQVLSDRLAGSVELQAGGAGEAVAKNYSMEPGAPVGVQLVRGDLSLTSVGTVTHIGEAGVYMFGHPFLQGGEVELPLTEAFVHTLMPSYNSSFKLSSPGKPIGTVTEDRQAAIIGELGPSPDMLPVKINLTVPDENFKRTYQVELIRDQSLTPGLLNSTALNFALSHMSQMGSNRINSNVRVTMPDREDITFRTTTVSPSSVDPMALIPVSSLWNNPYDEFNPTSVELQMELQKEQDQAVIEEAWLDRDRVEPGETVTIYARVRPYREESRIETYQFTIPEDQPARPAQLTLVSAEQLLAIEPTPNSLNDIIKLMNRIHGADELALVLEYPGASVERDGIRMEGLPHTVAGMLTTGTSRIERDIKTIRTPWVLSGVARIPLEVQSND